MIAPTAVAAPASSLELPDLDTRAIHGGRASDPSTGAILAPICQSTTFVQEAVGVDKGYTYTRAGNPTVAALEQALGELEDALPAACFATGMASITALFLALLKSGDHVIVSDVVYGGTVRLLREILTGLGVRATFVDSSDPANVQAAIEETTKLIFIETPANPTLKLTDLRAVAEIASAAGVLLAVDNTFLTPVLQRPLDLGADITVYSTTKFIEGHNATVGGALLARDEDLLERFRFVSKSIGFAQSPFEAWLTLRGLKTLPLRLEKHSANALTVARWLAEHPAIDHVDYPFLESFPQYDLARRQQSDGGGIVAFELTGGTEAGIRLLNSVKLCALAENLGAVETLITHPASMTHADVPRDQRSATGITDGLVRLSVGLESPSDIIADLGQALHAARRGAA
jgi:cystathionine beta-lyase/cystathionine gamma-synthase